MNSHTPGPWTVGDGPDWPNREVRGAPGGRVAEVWVHDGSEETREANARLIAAAPEQNEALRLLADCIEKCVRCDGSGQHPRRPDESCDACGGVGEVFGPGAGGHIGAVRAAIAKATGGDR